MGLGGLQREPVEVRLPRVLGTPRAVGRVEDAVRVDLPLKPIKGFCRAGAVRAEGSSVLAQLWWAAMRAVSTRAAGSRAGTVRLPPSGLWPVPVSGTRERVLRNQLGAMLPRRIRLTASRARTSAALEP